MIFAGEYQNVSVVQGNQDEKVSAFCEEQNQFCPKLPSRNAYFKFRGEEISD